MDTVGFDKGGRREVEKTKGVKSSKEETHSPRISSGGRELGKS